MPSAAAKKPTKSTPPTWSKIEGGRTTTKPKTQSPKSKPRSPKLSVHSTKSAIRNPQSAIKLPAHVRRELVALLMLVVGVLFIVGLVGWNGGAQNIVGIMGSFLAQLFGLAAWLVPIVMIAGACVLLIGAKLDAKWLSPLVPAGSVILLLGVMGFLHLFTNGQRAADLGQGRLPRPRPIDILLRVPDKDRCSRCPARPHRAGRDAGVRPVPRADSARRGQAYPCGGPSRRSGPR